MSQDLRKVSGYLLGASIPLQKAFERASLYSTPKSGQTALVIYEKSILGKKIIHQPLFEMNAVKAGRLGNGSEVVSKVVGGAGIVLAGYDIYNNGFTTSNRLDIGQA